MDKSLKDIGRNAYESIREMVEALQLDWGRLEELREERDDWEPEDNDGKLWENTENAEELAELEASAGECNSEDEARDRITEDPLSLQVRSDWRDVGDDGEAKEYCLLLTTGGPAVRIVGQLSRGEPASARLEVQDWGTPWTEHVDADESVLLQYASVFYYGE